MKEIKTEDLTGQTVEPIQIFLAPPPDKDPNALVPYKVFNGILQKNFTTIGNELYGNKRIEMELINKIAEALRRIEVLEAELAEYRKTDTMN